MNDITAHKHDTQILHYLANRMDAAEKTQFEVRMLEEPDLLERVQLLEAMQTTLREEESALLADDTEQQFRVLPFKYQFRQPLALAASVLVAVLGTYLLTGTPESASISGAVPVGSLVMLEARRDETIPAFTGPGPYLFQIDVGLDAQTDSVKLVLTESATGAVLARQEMVAVDAEGWSRLLYTQPLNGEYRMSAEAADGTGVPSSYRFVVSNP